MDWTKLKWQQEQTLLVSNSTHQRQFLFIVKGQIILPPSGNLCSQWKITDYSSHGACLLGDIDMGNLCVHTCGTGQSSQLFIL